MGAATAHGRKSRPWLPPIRSRFAGSRFRQNCGKAAALTAGFRAASGAVIFTLDADLQDDPDEIHRFLEKLGEGFDLVSGWKKVRHDPWHKVLPSRVFNQMLSHFSGVKLHDHNCGFKCYRAEVAKSLTLHGEMHRMVPALSAIGGFKSTEIVVRHHPRVHGVSKYGFERYIRGFMDMVTVGFLRKYRERPSHFLGAIVAICGRLRAGFDRGRAGHGHRLAHRRGAGGDRLRRRPGRDGGHDLRHRPAGRTGHPGRAPDHHGNCRSSRTLRARTIRRT